ncbi:MAG TPA: hypothetical protein VE954_41775 [Oligoflexus sp.]|uniref:hypothetical protein n=1 Tax=Oligoflexus sp. TaxID=1971216 RepID=UPI002D2BA883|nr:hypothetical protein [Oligoflexus sp.]HYX39672.1 hypothetical protein [Oligoflexus sp.]
MNEKQVASIARQAVATDRLGDEAWMHKQLATFHKQLTEPVPKPQSQKKVEVLDIDLTKMLPIVGRSTELSLKFDEIPNAVPIGDKKVFFKIKSDERVFDVTLGEKAMNKALDEMIKGPWLGMVKGKLGSATDTGFVIENAQIQVFLRIPKAGAN